MSVRYNVSFCPYSDLDGHYVLDETSDVPVYRRTVWYKSCAQYSLYRLGPGIGWVIADKEKVLCKHTIDSAAPLEEGWYYWNKWVGRYTSCRTMTVSPSSNYPPTETQATNSAVPSMDPSMNLVPPESATTTSPPAALSEQPNETDAEQPAPHTNSPEAEAKPQTTGSLGPSNVVALQDGFCTQAPPEDVEVGIARMMQFQLATLLRKLEGGKDDLSNHLAAARSNKRDYDFIAKLGRQLKATEAQFEQLRLLDEEDYRTLPERREVLLQRVETKCAELANTDDFEALAQLAGALDHLRGLSGVNNPIYVGPERP